MKSIVLPDGTVHRHTEPEMDLIRQEFKEWYFDPFKEGTVKDWALAHKVSYQWVCQQKKEPSFVAMMDEFRSTYRERGDAALQRLFRIAEEEPARVAIPAIKIIADVMGYNAAQKLEVSTKGMTMADYLMYIQQQAQEKVKVGTPAIEAQPPIEGQFTEQAQEDPWETSEEEVAA